MNVSLQNQSKKATGNINDMAENLFWKLRDSVFSMDKRGEGFPCYIAERVIKYSPKTLLNRPIILALIVHRLMNVIVQDPLFSECEDAINVELGI